MSGVCPVNGFLLLQFSFQRFKEMNSLVLGSGTNQGCRGRPYTAPVSVTFWSLSVKEPILF